MSNIPEQLKNSTVVLAGASSGFGRGAAIEIAKQGANVVVAARRSDLLQEVVEIITKEGGKAIAVTADVSIPKDIEQLAQTAVETFGRIDVWINNVGIGALGYFWEIPADVHARLIDVNLKGLVYGAHVALKQFVSQQGGTLINIGSVDSELPVALQNTYAATKAAVLSLGRSLNEELRLSGNDKTIHVSTIMPWAVDTPWWLHAANYTGHSPSMPLMDDPKLVVDAIVKACTEPKEEMPVGFKAKASTLSHKMFPDLTETLTGTISKKESKKGKTTPYTNGSLFEPVHEGRGIDGGR